MLNIFHEDKPENIFEKIIIALDVPSQEEALQIIRHTHPPIDFYKVGLELYNSAGADFVKNLKAKGLKIFLDLKLHDIPSTVAKAVTSIAKMDTDMITVHTFGGHEMLKAAVEGAKTQNPDIKVMGVTVLTSLDEIAIRHIGIDINIGKLVERLSTIANDCGLDGIICSATDLSFLRSKLPQPFLMVTPGIRKPGDTTADQKRTATPIQALNNGADYLVVGRSVTAQKDCKQALEQLFA